jgi:AraC-like DNA-binding protein
VSGSAVLEDPGGGPPQQLMAGDILLIPDGTEHKLHDGSGTTPSPARKRATLNLIISENSGTGARVDLLCGRFLLTPHFGDPSRPWTLPELARLCHLSRATFARQFQERLGRSASDLLTDIRMTMAANELRKSSLSTGAVADMVGYRSEAAFQRAFKQRMGVTPAQWRRAGDDSSD